MLRRELVGLEGRQGNFHPGALMPQLWVVAGPNGAGKSTLASLRVAGRVFFVNPDDIARRIQSIGDPTAQTLIAAARQENRLLASRNSVGFEIPTGF
jgi:predicted ABC-type ATPase